VVADVIDARSPAAPAANRQRSILAGSAGNLVESFDWFVYAAFGLYFSKVFFPDGDRTTQLLNTAAVFGVGFFARPIGAWLMGSTAIASAARRRWSRRSA
jgi:MHS family alpha-ketoglutarate permease-like MFS transporter